MLEPLKPFVVALLLVLLSACATTDPVFLRHPQTGTVVQCGPYDFRPYQAAPSAMLERGCIEDYQRQGYERVPK